MRLFVAVFPDAAVTAALDDAVADLDPARWRPVAPDRRHVTVRFHADADPDTVAADLQRGLDERAPSVVPDPGRRPGVLDDHGPTLRCAGAGTFGSALWVGVQPGDHAHDTAAWHTLLRAAGTDPSDYVAHLTVARGRGAVPERLQAHDGPSWTPTEVLLVASGTPYRVIERFPLVRAPGADEAVGRPR